MTVHTQLTTRVRRSLPFVPPLHVSPDGRWLFVYSSYGARVFDAAIPGEAVWSLDVRVSAMLPLVERGVLVLAARARRRSYGELSVLDLATLDTIHDQRLHHTVNTIERVSADLVTLRSGYGAMSFELNTHTITGFTAHTNLPISAALLTSPSTPRAVQVTSIHNSQTKDYDYTLQLWSTGEGAAPLGEPFACPGIAVSLQWRPDGSSFCIVHHDRALRVWDGETGQLRATLPITVESPLLLVILPDGLRAVVAGYDGSCELITLPD